MTLEDFSKDDRYPFTGFETDHRSYEQSHNFWENSFLTAVGNQASAWTDWMADPFKDGHPILSKICETPFRGVLLQQVLQSADPGWFKCWIATLEADGPEPAMPYLFVETFVSEPGRHLFQKLVDAWCNRGLDLDSMHRMTDQVRMEAFGAYRITDFGRKS